MYFHVFSFWKKIQLVVVLVGPPFWKINEQRSGGTEEVQGGEKRDDWAKMSNTKKTGI